MKVYDASGNLQIATPTSDHGSLGGLSDDDHQQYVKDSEFTQDSGILVGTGASAFAEETGATLRTSIGVGTGNTPQFARQQGYHPHPMPLLY